MSPERRTIPPGTRRPRFPDPRRGRRLLVATALLLSGSLLSGCGGSPASGFRFSGPPVVITGSPMDVPIPHLGTARLSFDPFPAAPSTVVEVTLVDREGRPVEGAGVRAAYDMPAHRHGSIPAELAALGPGVYRAALHFSMAGTWRIAFTIRRGSERFELQTEVRVRFAAPSQSSPAQGSMPDHMTH
ncbi:MAG: FixH family protein [Acidobacteria bacterium]|nr:FixH family protein [Acidobacteriota bacterium]